jgi:hypothetical protein
MVHITATLEGDAGNDNITARMGIGPTPFLPITHVNVHLDGGAGTHPEVCEVENLLNNRPRACLQFETPAAVFHRKTVLPNSD